MDIFEYAMKMEREGEAFYRQMADQVADPGMQKILLLLAEDEVRHFKIFQEMKKSSPKISPTRILEHAQSVFEMWREEKVQLDTLKDQIVLLRKAQDIEKKTEDHYRQFAQEFKEDKAKVFLQLAEEEKKHFLLLDHLIEALEKPKYFLEHGEAFRWEDF